MSKIEDLIAAYRRTVAMPWRQNLSGAEKVWFAVYDPTQERRVRLRVEEFALATKEAQHKWRLVDITDSFARWMASHRYRDTYFEEPEKMTLALERYTDTVTETVKGVLTANDVDENTVVAVLGAGSLFGLTHVSTVIEGAAPRVRGRLLVFFPGHHDGLRYRLLDARDGWNYLAVPITA